MMMMMIVMMVNLIMTAPLFYDGDDNSKWRFVIERNNRLMRRKIRECSLLDAYSTMKIAGRCIER